MQEYNPYESALPFFVIRKPNFMKDHSISETCIDQSTEGSKYIGEPIGGDNNDGKRC